MRNTAPGFSMMIILLFALGLDTEEGATQAIFGPAGELRVYDEAVGNAAGAAQLLPVGMPTFAQPTFGVDIQIDDGTPYSVHQPQLVVDASGALRAAFRIHVDPTIGWYQIYYTWRPIDGAPWRWPNTRVTEPSGVNEPRGIPAICAFEDGAAMIWWDKELGVGDRFRFARVDEDHQVSEITAPFDDDAWQDVSYQRLHAFENKLYLVWDYLDEELHEDYTHLAMSEDGGATWTLLPDPTYPNHPLRDASTGPSSLAIGAGGELYLAHVSTSHRVKVWRSFDEGATWEGPAVLGDLMDVSFACDLAVSPGGRVGLVWEANLDEGSDLLFTFSDDHFTTWNRPAIHINEAWPKGGYYFPRLGVGRDGTWHLAHLWNWPWSQIVNALYAYSPDGMSWSDPEQVNDAYGTVNPLGPYSVSLAVDDDGFAHVAWVYSQNPGSLDHALYDSNRPFAVDVADAAGDVPEGALRVVSGDRLLVLHPSAGSATVLRAYDVGGRMVRQILVAPSQTRTIVSDLAPGVYFIDVSSDAARATGHGVVFP